MLAVAERAVDARILLETPAEEPQEIGEAVEIDYQGSPDDFRLRKLHHKPFPPPANRPCKMQMSADRFSAGKNKRLQRPELRLQGIDDRLKIISVP